MSKATAIRALLAEFDPAVDEQWTEDGLPLLDVFPKETTRADIAAAAPHFSRENPVIETAATKEDIARDEAAERTNSLLGRKAELSKLITDKQRELMGTQQELAKLLAQLDDVERGLAREAPNAQTTIMDYLAAQRRRYEQKG